MSSSNHVLITGCGGMLGKSFYEKAVEKYGKENPIVCHKVGWAGPFEITL